VNIYFWKVTEKITNSIREEKKSFFQKIICLIAKNKCWKTINALEGA